MRMLIAAENGQADNDPLDEPAMLYHEADYVMDTWLERKLYGLYPAAGGYNDQDDWLMRDWRKMTLYYLRAKAGVFSAISMPRQAPDWHALMGD